MSKALIMATAALAVAAAPQTILDGQWSIEVSDTVDGYWNGDVPTYWEYTTAAAMASNEGCQAACVEDPTCAGWSSQLLPGNASSICWGNDQAGVDTGLAAFGQGYASALVQRNPSVAYIALWVAFAFMAAAGLVFLFLSYVRNVKPEAALTYFLVTAINLITALAYLIMAIGGPVWTPSFPAASATGDDIPRAFQWLRYAAWVLVAPLTVLILGLLSGAHWVRIAWVALAAVVSVGALFAGAVSQGAVAAWPLLAFALLVGVAVFIGLAITFRSAAYKVHAEIGQLYDVLGLGSLVLYAGYAIVWGTSEGGKWTTADEEVIIYAVLDILTKAVFGTVLLFSREAIARYGSCFGGFNTGVDFDFPIARSTVTSSAINYSTEGGHAIVFGEPRDLAFAQLHGATGTGLTAKTA